MGEWGCFFPTSVCQWGHRMEQEFTEIDWHGLSMVIYCCTLGDEGRRAEKKKWSEKHLAVTLGTPCPLMSVMRTSIIWLSLFHRSLVISLHVGTKQCGVQPRGLFSLCVIRFMCGILVYTSRCAYRQTDIENDWSSSPKQYLVPLPPITQFQA